MATIPQPVLGGATVTVFAAITMSGIQLLNEQPLNSRNRMIVGIALAIGLGIDASPRSCSLCPSCCATSSAAAWWSPSSSSLC